MMNSLDATLPTTFQSPGTKLILKSGQTPSLASLSHIVLCALACTIRQKITPTRTQAENLATKPLSALTSTNTLTTNIIPAISHTTAIAVAQETMPSSTLPVPNSRQVTTDQTTPAIAARIKVEQCQLDCNPTVSTLLNADKLVLELVNHPDSSFVNNLLNALWYGYLGPHKPRVSRNLLSASQHPEVVSLTQHK